jgi:EF hand
MTRRSSARRRPADWKAVNKDHDNTIEMDEWLMVARERFNAADANKDGKLTAKELDSPAGQELIKMIIK